jgi:hypothetical protein
VILVGQQIADTPNRTCDLQQIGHKIAHEIARVTSPIAPNLERVIVPSRMVQPSLQNGAAYHNIGTVQNSRLLLNSVFVYSSLL